MNALRAASQSTTNISTHSGSGTLTLGGSGAILGGNSTGIIAQPITALNIPDMFNESHYERLTYFKFNEDVLALSCAWWRIRNTPSEKQPVHTMICKLTDHQLITLVTSEDRNHAEKIRDYYSKLIVMWNLKGKRISSFRKNLQEFMEDSKKVRDDHLGIAYRLPEFYAYDHKLDAIRAENFDDRINKKYHKSSRFKDTLDLVPVDKLHRKTKHIDKFVYWLKTADSNTGVALEVGRTNELLSVWDNIFNSKQTISINGVYSFSDILDFEHYKVSNWKINNILSLR